MGGEAEEAIHYPLSAVNALPKQPVFAESSSGRREKGGKMLLHFPSAPPTIGKSGLYRTLMFLRSIASGVYSENNSITALKECSKNEK